MSHASHAVYFFKKKIMESLPCGICASTHRKFVCVSCIHDRLTANQNATDLAAAERMAVVDKIDLVLEGMGPTGVSLEVETHSRRLTLEDLEAVIARMRMELDRDKGRIASMKQNLLLRRAALSKAKSILSRDRANLSASSKRQIEETQKRFAATSEILTQSRRLLIRELVSVFRLRKVQRSGQNLLSRDKNAGEVVDATSLFGNESGGGSVATPSMEIAKRLFYEEPQEYKLINVGFSAYGDYLAYPREKFNAGLGHAVHITIIMSHYLGVTLPFQIVYRGSKSVAKPGIISLTGLLDKSAMVPNQLPLYLTDTNAETFGIGLAMLNYNVSFMCHSQGVEIPIHQVPNTLENIAQCCRAANLGWDSHWNLMRSNQFPSSSTTTPISNPTTVSTPFSLDFTKVYKLHAALRLRKRPHRGTSTGAVSVSNSNMYNHSSGGGGGGVGGGNGDGNGGNRSSNSIGNTRDIQSYRTSAVAAVERVTDFLLVTRNAGGGGGISSITSAAATAASAASAASAAAVAAAPALFGTWMTQQQRLQEQHTTESDVIVDGDLGGVVVGDPGLFMLATVLDEESGDDGDDDENENTGWHLV